MMATQRLPVPQHARDFLNAGNRCPSIPVALWRDHRVIQLHRRMRRNKKHDDEGMLSFVGLPTAPAFTDGGQLTGATYQCRLGYLLFDVSWRLDNEASSMHETQIIQVPIINARLRDRMKWLPVEARGLAYRARRTLGVAG